MHVVYCNWIDVHCIQTVQYSIYPNKIRVDKQCKSLSVYEIIVWFKNGFNCTLLKVWKYDPFVFAYCMKK